MKGVHCGKAVALSCAAHVGSTANCSSFEAAFASTMDMNIGEMNGRVDAIQSATVFQSR